jgi:hypothetical protein
MESMAQRTVTRFLLGALMLAGGPCLALAQDQVGPKDLTRNTADPVDRLVGLWRVDRIDLDAPSDWLRGRVLRIDRQTVETLTLGTCTNPSFAEQLGSITVSCLGQGLASAAWNPQAPGTIQWSEAGFKARLKRISGTETLDSPPPAADAPPEGAPADDAPAEPEGSEDSE